MKQILIYGDSNVHGETERAAVRYSAHERWSGRLKTALRGRAEVVEEGFSGRAAGDIKTGDQTPANGHLHFPTVYLSHTPLDLVVIALGTNDCWKKYRQTSEAILENLKWYIEETRVREKTESHAPTPRFLFLIPPSSTAADFDDTVRGELQQRMIEALPSVLIENVEYRPDEVHFSPEGHATVASAVRQAIEKELDL